MMALVDRDLPGRLLAAVVRVVPGERRDWGRAMEAELAAVEARPDRWSFTRGCLRAAAGQFGLLRGALHLGAVLGTLGAVLAWAAAIGDPLVSGILYVAATVLAAVCWAARRAGMLGPADDSPAAWLLRGLGYLIAAGVVATGLTVVHSGAAGTDGRGAALMFGVIATGYLLAGATICAHRSAATKQVIFTGAGIGLGATLVWVATVFIAPPIPVTVEWSLALTGVAAVAAVAANSGRRSTNGGCLLAALLAVTTTLALTFLSVLLLAHLGADRLIPDVTPHALPADRISESRIEIVDPYVLVLVLSGLAAIVLSVTAVATRRPARPTTGRLPRAAAQHA
jgi:hypothetical protein